MPEYGKETRRHPTSLNDVIRRTVELIPPQTKYERVSFCYRIVKSHGGTIEVESAARSGARFTVRLPVKNAAAISAARSAATARGAIGGRRIKGA